MKKAKPQLKKLKKPIAKAMAAKPAKKAQVKAAKKVVPAQGMAKKAVAMVKKVIQNVSTKSAPAPLKTPLKAAVKAVASKKTPPVKPQMVAAVLAKNLPAKQAQVTAKPVLSKQAAQAEAAKSKTARINAAALAEFEKLCRENGCENAATTKGYCRLDYIKNWKKIKRKEMILKEGKLNQYIEELVGKYPDKYIDVIRQDLSSEVNFTKVIHDLELDESIDDLDYDGDSIDSLIGSIKKEEGGFDD